MMKENTNQVIVISGESGAGKTESTKLIMQYLAAVNRSPSNTITEQILEANPLLESFGNAKTTRNDNSSRFGKYLEVYFKNGFIIGAKISEYLLEKSRIVSQASGERNYHVMYEMLAGLDDEQKRKLGLSDSPKSYFYLNAQSAVTTIECKDDRDDFVSLKAAIEILGFGKHEQETIFKILAAVLHIGNIYFNRIKQDEPSVEIGADAEIKWVAFLLSINDQVLRQKLTHKITETRDEKVLTPFNVDQALDARDAIAKALYARLFSWLVERVNGIISGGNTGCKTSQSEQSKETLDKASSGIVASNSIAILDIFGFENFLGANGFEQLCINYANETLQFYFNKHIFKLEQEEYAKERIAWKNIAYVDNKPCIDLIAKKPNGIIHVLDDESSFPKTTDSSFLEKCHFLHGHNSLYNKPRMASPPVFSIKHYAGEVIYEVKNFLDKNRDLLRPGVIEMFINSRNQFLSKMFRDMREKNGEQHQRSCSKTGRFVTLKPKTPTVAAQFHDSLANLLDAMSNCNPFFVRCIKPNNCKTAMRFDMRVVLEQLNYTGMLETIRIRKLGYPIRYKFAYFVQRYRALIANTTTTTSTHLIGNTSCNDQAKDLACLILSKLDHNKFKQMYQIGQTKIFLRELLDQHLEQQRIQITRRSAIIIQKTLRMFVARSKFLKLRHSAIILQSHFKCVQQRNRYQKMKIGFIKAQAQFRMIRERKRYLRLKDRMKELKDAQTQKSPDLVHKEYDGDLRWRIMKNNNSKEKKNVSFHLLDIPPELAFIYTKVDAWDQVHTEQNILKLLDHTSNEMYCRIADTATSRLQLPSDINSFSFNKFIQIYIKDSWERTLSPIEKPFLAKTNMSDVQESISMFKLILRYVNSHEFDAKRDKLLADYIVQKGLMNIKLRDEILVQIVNQTWHTSDNNSHHDDEITTSMMISNDDIIANSKAWHLLAHCLSCFSPTSSLHKYLLKYASDHAPNDAYKFFCQQKLLRCGQIEAQLARTYPPSFLEWRSSGATTAYSSIALQLNFVDDKELLCEADSWSTGEDMCRTSLLHRHLNESESNGWTLSLRDENDFYEIMGNDYVLDLVSEMEIAPAFPVCKSFFLVSSMSSEEDKSCSSSTNKNNNNQKKKKKRKHFVPGSNNLDSVYNWYFDVDQKQQQQHEPTSSNQTKKPIRSQQNEAQMSQKPPTPIQQHRVINRQDRSNSGGRGNDFLKSSETVISSKPPPPSSTSSSPSRSNKRLHHFQPPPSQKLISSDSIATANTPIIPPAQPSPPIHYTQIPSLPPSSPKAINVFRDRVSYDNHSSSRLNAANRKLMMAAPPSPPQPKTQLLGNHDDDDDEFSDDDDDDDDDDDIEDKNSIIDIRKKSNKSNNKSKINDRKTPTIKKEKFRFRFEPTKTSLTKIEFKDSTSDTTTITASNTLTHTTKRGEQHQMPLPRRKTPLPMAMMMMPPIKHKMPTSHVSVASLKRKSLKKKGNKSFSKLAPMQTPSPQTSFKPPQPPSSSHSSYVTRRGTEDTKLGKQYDVNELKERKEATLSKCSKLNLRYVRKQPNLLQLRNNNNGNGMNKNSLLRRKMANGKLVNAAPSSPLSRLEKEETKRVSTSRADQSHLQKQQRKNNNNNNTHGNGHGRRQSIAYYLFLILLFFRKLLSHLSK